MRTKEEYLELLNEIKWEKGKEIESFLIPAINIELEDYQNGTEIGISKFGGNPDLPSNIKWPISENEPMTFLAQLNLNQISEFDLENLLPKSGFLYFFIANPAEFSLDHKVIYSKDLELSKREFPKELNDDCKFNQLKMSFQTIYTFPSGETLEIESLSENDQESYFELDEDFFTYESNQILGHTYPMQGDVKLEWAFGSLGIEMSSDTYNEDQARIDYLRNDFLNLFQFSTENSVPEFYENFYINAMGYFGIRKQDLIENKFDETIFIIQN